MTQSIVVIGPGPVSPGMLDAYTDGDPVVQMWDHDWQPVDRYGSRYDYGLITRTGEAHAASRTPEVAWFFYNVPHEKAPSSINGKPIVVLDHVRWQVKADALGAKSGNGRGFKFTRGFAAVAGAIEHLSPRRVIVVGMEVLRNGVTGSRYYDPAALPFYVKSYPVLAKACPEWAADEMTAGCLRAGPHDYSAEAVLIRELAAEAGVELVWDVELDEGKT
jgi:hypothetical protein